MYGLEIKVKSRYWLSVSCMTAKQKCHYSKGYGAKIFHINKVSAPKFPGQRDTAYQFNYPSVTWGPNLEFQTSVL